MNRFVCTAGAVASVFLLAFPVQAQDRHGERGGEHGGAHSVRQAPPQFQAHPPGMHPHGPIVRQHPVRVLQPRVVEQDRREWRHWEHAEFSRPVYYWNWEAVHQVSCTAEDSYGDQYPVTQTWTAGWGLDNMTAVEDAALDRCAAESGGDTSCVLMTCSHF